MAVSLIRLAPYRCRWCQRSSCWDDLQFFVDQALKFFNAEFGNQEFNPRLGAVLFLAQAAKNAADGLHQWQQLVFAAEFFQQAGLIRHGAQATTNVDVEALDHFAADCFGTTNHADVVHHRQAAGLAGAAREGDFHFTAKVLRVLMTEQELRTARRRTVCQSLGFAHASPAQPVMLRTELPQASRVVMPTAAKRRIRSGVSVEVDEVQLDVLARGYVQDAVRVLLGQFSHAFHLGRVQTTVGNLDANHARGVKSRHRTFGQVTAWVVQLTRFKAVVTLAVVVALAIRAAPQAGFSEYFFIHFALTQFDLFLKQVNFITQLVAHLIAEAVVPGAAHSGNLRNGCKSSDAASIRTKLIGFVRLAGAGQAKGLFLWPRCVELGHCVT